MATTIPLEKGGERLVGFLRSVPVLRELDERELRALAATPTQWSFDQEERVFAEGEPGTALYIVEDGACGLEIEGRVVRYFGSGDVFGEIALIDRRPRTATVRATRPARLLAFESEALGRFEATEPAAALKLHKALARQLTGYVRDAGALYDQMDVLLVQDGGCAPGYDSVTAQLTRALEEVGRHVFVAREGFKSLVSGSARDFSCLIHDRALYERLEHVQGVIHSAPLAAARGASFRTERFREFQQVDLQRRAADHIVARGVNVLIGIGGNGTFAGTNALSKLLPERVRTFFVPVTIDSDISGTECIGEHTGVMIGAEKIHGYLADARTHDRIYIIEMMGAEGGYHALHSCLGAGGDLAVLPSSRYDPARVARALARRSSAVIVVAEGYKRGERSEGSSGNAAEYFYQELLRAGFDPKRKIVCEGFSRDVRGAAPNYRDITLAQRMARRLVALLLEGRTRVMPAILASGEGAIAFDDVRTDNSVESGLAELANRLGA